MTDPIQDERLDEYELPGVGWLDCPVLPPTDMLATIKRSDVLDGRSRNLFGALERPWRSGLVELYVGENLYRPGSHYIYVTPDAEQFGFKCFQPAVTKIVIEAKTFRPCALFSNTLAWGDTPPSERAFNSGFTVYTMELDRSPLDYQLRIIWSGKLKQMNAELCRFRDYRGFEAVYSGSKSVHFHFILDTRHLNRHLTAANSSYRDNWTSDLPDALLRPAHALCWQRLAETFVRIAEIDDAPDPRLKSWEQLRRFPWGLRQVKGAHPLGIPADHRIPQVVLSSNVFTNAKRGATEWFHEPRALLEQCGKEPARRKPKSFIEIDFALKGRELDLFEQHAPEIFQRIIGTAYPKWAGFEVNEKGFRCCFHNGPDDTKPSSFCEGNRDRIVLQGRHGFESEGVLLEATPNQVFDWIVARYGDDHDPPDNWLMRRYRAAVHDRGSLARFLDDHIVDVVTPLVTSATPAWMARSMGQRDRSNTHVWIRGPQGCGKSTKTMAAIPMIYERDPGVIFISSPSIEQASEKLGTFNRVNQDERFVPYLYLSLTALYERFCPEADRLDHIDILEEGGSSWLHAVFQRQPEVYEAMLSIDVSWPS